MFKIYTKTGDKGLTSLASGDRVPKYDLRVEAYGSIDELNSHLGLLTTLLIKDVTKEVQSLSKPCSQIQNELFDLGSELSYASTSQAHAANLLPKTSIARLEREIDAFSQNCPPLRNFILPGGHLCSAHAHICRSTARRCERLLLNLNNTHPLRQEVLIYFNRLSDWFFIVARYICAQAKAPEVIWKPLEARNLDGQ